MSAVRKVERFECGNCKRTFKTDKEAGACCLCKCGAPVPKRDGFGSSLRDECERCRLRGCVRHAQTRVRQLKSDLAGAEAHLTSVTALYEAEKAKVAS